MRATGSQGKVCRLKWGFGSGLPKASGWNVLLWLSVLYEKTWHCQRYSQLPLWWWEWWIFEQPCPRRQACARRWTCSMKWIFRWRRLLWWANLTSFSFPYFGRLWPGLSYLYIECIHFWVFFFNMIALINFSSNVLSLLICSYYTISISNFY